MYVSSELTLLNVKFHNIKVESLLNLILKKVKNGEKFIISLSNPEFLLESEKNQELKKYLNNVSLNLADGIGVVWASKILSKKPLFERITGTDLLPELINLSLVNKLRFYFLGGGFGVAEKARDKFKNDFGYNGVIGYQHGFFENNEENNIIQKINMLSPDILMVCLGNPKQEEWIERNFDKLNVKLVFGNGGALDFWSNNVQRAPMWMQNLGFEWLFRLFQDFTWKRIKRQSRLIVFPFLVLKQFAKQGFKRI